MDEWLRGLPGVMGYWAIERTIELLVGGAILWGLRNKEKLVPSGYGKLLNARVMARGSSSVSATPTEIKSRRPRANALLAAAEELATWYLFSR